MGATATEWVLGEPHFWEGFKQRLFGVSPNKISNTSFGGAGVLCKQPWTWFHWDVFDWDVTEITHEGGGYTRIVGRVSWGGSGWW